MPETEVYNITDEELDGLIEKTLANLPYLPFGATIRSTKVSQPAGSITPHQ